MKIREKEVLRYLGCGSNPPDEALEKLIVSCKEELLRSVAPRCVFRTFPLRFDGGSVWVGSMEVPGSSLREHLSGCREAVLFAATLGVQADILLERSARLEISRAAVLQAASAAAIESFCDEQEAEIARDAAWRGLFLRPRFSPGYGDFPIRLQREILALLDCPKRIGLTATDSFMLAPAKSVTAVIGLTAEKTSCHIAKCMGCHAENCPFRKEQTDESAE